MIFTLLTEVVAFHVRLSIIEIGEPSLQLSFSLTGKFGTTGLSLEERIHTELCHPPEVLLGILSRSRDRDWSIRNWSIQRACVAWRGSSSLRGFTESGGTRWVSASATSYHGGAWNCLPEFLQTGWLTCWVWRN